MIQTTEYAVSQLNAAVLVVDEGQDFYAAYRQAWPLDPGYPPERLAYTWTWEGEMSPDSVDSLVAVDFLEHDGGTTVVLTHSGFKSTESRDGHTGGWNACLDNLEARVFAEH